MINFDSFHNCVLTLINHMKGKEGILFVVVKQTLGRTYTIYGLQDPQLDWSRIAAGEQRVVLCLSANELSTLLTTSKDQEEI